VEQANKLERRVHPVSGLAGMDWNKLLMPEGMSETEDLEEDSVEKVVKDDIDHSL
jgi:hypothetical protein